MFSRSPISKVRPRSSPAGAIDRLRDAAERADRALPGSRFTGIETPSGLLRRKEGRRTWHARLTGSANPYQISEVYGTKTAGAGLWTPMPKARASIQAYELNGTEGLGGEVVEVHRVGLGWYWFLWKTRPNSFSGGGNGTVVTIPICYCGQLPVNLTMKSCDPLCNFSMFQNCTISYQPTPAWALPLNLGPNLFLSNQGFPDPILGGSTFYYLLTCQYNQFSLTRLYPTCPYGTPYRDGILYTWLAGQLQAGAIINYCEDDLLVLGGGMPFLGSDLTCCVKIWGGDGATEPNCSILNGPALC